MNTLKKFWRKYGPPGKSLRENIGLIIMAILAYLYYPIFLLKKKLFKK